MHESLNFTAKYVIHFSKKQSEISVRPIMNLWTSGRSDHAPDREHDVDTVKLADFYDTVVPSITYFVHLWDVDFFSQYNTGAHVGVWANKLGYILNLRCLILF
jgi:hypothetical protein